MHLIKHIDRFSKFFQNHISNVNELPNGEPHRDYKKILFLSILDGMSKPIYSNGSNRQRLTNFLRDFSDWSEGDRVSLPHLSRLLEKYPTLEFEHLREYIHNRLLEWPHGEPTYLEKDPLISELIIYWPREDESFVPLKGITIEKLQHWNLFYTFRNQLVHELQAPAFSLDDYAVSNEPFYVRVIMDEMYDGSNAIYHLVYPVIHFYNLCVSSLRKTGVSEIVCK